MFLIGVFRQLVVASLGLTYLVMQEAAQALGLQSHMDPKGDIAPELLAREDHFGCPSGEPDQWGSCVRLAKVAPDGLTTSSVLHLDKLSLIHI